MECGRWLDDTLTSSQPVSAPAPSTRPSLSLRTVPPALSAEEQARIDAEGQRFTRKAVVTAVLYLLLLVPGVVANVVFWRQADRVENLTGIAPPGKGCLTAMLVVAAIVLVLGMFLVLAILSTV